MVAPTVEQPGCGRRTSWPSGGPGLVYGSRLPRVFKLLWNGTSVEVANGREESTATIVLNSGSVPVALATAVIEMSVATGMQR